MLRTTLEKLVGDLTMLLSLWIIASPQFGSVSSSKGFRVDSNDGGIVR